jgi:hypothetical protein
MTHRIKFAAIAMLAVAGGAAIAADPAPEQRRPAAAAALVRCRAIENDEARLRCFDQSAAALQEAADKREVVVVDRRQIRETRRRLFGLDLPNLPFFGGGGDDEAREEVSSIDGEIAEVRSAGRLWVIRLKEGGTWTQADGSRRGQQPKVGSKVKIKKGALGSYIMEFEGRTGFKVRRTG